MSQHKEKFMIVGRATPYHVDNPIIELAEISIDVSHVSVELMQGNGKPLRLTCEIWEHTIHELETLSAALHRTSTESVPATVEVPRHKSLIGRTVTLRLAINTELGYSLSDPHSTRAQFFCSSMRMGPPEQNLGIVIGGFSFEGLRRGDCRL